MPIFFGGDLNQAIEACHRLRERVSELGRPVDEFGAEYVALPIAHKTLYVAWLDPSTHAIVDAFVMNFKTGVVFDYAPGSASPDTPPGLAHVAALFNQFLAALGRDEEGQGLAEYALILALIAIVAIVALIFLGGAISSILSTVGSSV